MKLTRWELAAVFWAGWALGLATMAVLGWLFGW
jgi:hypothetical protein